MKLGASCWFLNMLQRHAEVSRSRNILVRDILRNEIVSVLGTSYSLALFLISCSFYFRLSTTTTLRQGTWSHTALPQYHIAASKSESSKHRFQILDSSYKIKLRFSIYSQIGVPNNELVCRVPEQSSSFCTHGRQFYLVRVLKILSQKQKMK